MSADPMDDLRRLTERLRQEASALGLELSQCAFIPHPTGSGPDVVQAAFLIKPEAVIEPEPVDPDQARVDEEFEALMGGESFKSAEDQQAEDEMKRIRDEAAKWLEEGK